jgi:hypothetical protein
MLMGETAWLVYGSMVQIKDLGGWSDEQIVDLAYVAHQARHTAHADARRNKKYERWLRRTGPTATTTMVVGNTAYISSSAKGARSFLYVGLDAAEAGDTGFRFRDLRREHDQTHEVGKALVRCQIANFDKSVGDTANDWLISSHRFGHWLSFYSFIGFHEWSLHRCQLRRAYGCAGLL